MAFNSTMNMKPAAKVSAAELKERRAREASQAMREVEAEKVAIRAKTERLRAARLAREASEPPAKKTRKPKSP